MSERVFYHALELDKTGATYLSPEYRSMSVLVDGVLGLLTMIRRRLLLTSPCLPASIDERTQSQVERDVQSVLHECCNIRARQSCIHCKIGQSVIRL